MVLRIAFATNRGGLEDIIADRFGRAPTFTIIDVDETTGNIINVRVTENPGSIAGSGAGIRAVQKLIDEKIDIVVAPSPGPNAFMALQQSGIKLYIMPGLSVKEALERVLKEVIKK